MSDIAAASQTPVNIEDEMKRSYMDYAMSVIVGRALPDARDGLKPAHRRVLYGMKTMGLSAGRGYRKCAKIVGEVMGNFHPHGDALIYDTLVRLAQDFDMRYPTVDGQGNFGSIDGDRPAAMRYTEARLQALADDMMTDLDKETVDFTPNYDETTEEPTVLPAPFPNLLVNGSAGIAVGMATNVPPHNMREVVELKRGEMPEVVLNNLYKHTQLQMSFGIIMLAIVGGRPKVMNLLELIETFVDFRRDVVRRRTEFELRKAEARYHILEGLKIALDHIDAVITLIRSSKSPAEARDGLM